jgi:hypothetical protein
MKFSMPKKLNEDAILNELHGQSLFFKPKKEAQESEPPSPIPIVIPPVEVKKPTPAIEPAPSRDTTTPRYRDTVIPRQGDTLIETTRRAVKQFGKEAATHRFTLEEKRALKAIEHEYSEKGIRTSENEITRIAINYVVEDYRSNGEKSVLARVVELLNS